MVDLADALVREGVDHCVHLAGHRSVARLLLDAADVFVLPSRHEGMPLVLLEAMDSGLPVVATRVIGSKEVVVDRETGFLVPSENPAALAVALARLLAEPELRRRFGEAGRRRFRERFTHERMAAATAALHEQVLAGEEALMKHLRVACVGTGWIAMRHLAAIAEIPGVDIAAVADPIRERADDTARRFGARSYSDGLALMAAEDLDAVWLCVPPFAHGSSRPRRSLGTCPSSSRSPWRSTSTRPYRSRQGCGNARS